MSESLEDLALRVMKDVVVPRREAALACNNHVAVVVCDLIAREIQLWLEGKTTPEDDERIDNLCRAALGDLRVPWPSPP